ncbi:MAG: type II/IV secretion system protein [Candidatus Kerfeldbacteria bacterium]|nr:type II/IV secretion system protein [Candidatus Kerfeldbacteria bacterium]
MSPPLPHVAPAEVEEALAARMSEIALKEKEQQTQARASGLGLGYINLVGFPIGPETIAVVPEAEAERLQAVCFLKTTAEIRLASTNPTNPGVQELGQTLGAKYHANVGLYMVSEHSLESALRNYRRLPKITKRISGIALAQADVERYRQEIKDFRHLGRYLKDASMTDVFTILLAGAIEAESSDVHIEAADQAIHVRYRIDGVLIPVATLEYALWPRIISRIKLIAGLKLNITSAPQDGRITIYLEDDKIDVRVSTLPTAFGESVVLRLLRSSASNIQFSDLGMRGKARDVLRQEIERPNGMIIVTGPTGSGKTTTLYAVLNQLNKPDTKIITLEDPIEYKLEGINQSQVDWAKGYTFAKGLRSILRQDPDIIMVGEIRDLDTAETSIQAALTGHLVLSTVHTNDAAGAIPRFLAMGAKTFLLAPALNTVVAQRLVRRVCDRCQREDELDARMNEQVKITLAAIPKSSGYAVDPGRPLRFVRGGGCDNCHGLGYRGRIGIFEVLVVNDEIEKIILEGKVSEYAMRAAASRQGMITMVQDGLLKALDGITTVEEVFRVAQ